ncbi:MAG: hypothetical protein IIB66_03675 [Proteobacteria bacterium]|nr:hypothetical protein [Pseudomonadota bacterium]
MIAAKRNGKRIGNRKRPFDREHAMRLRLQGTGVRKMASILGIGVSSVYTWMRDELGFDPARASEEVA